MYIFHKLYSKCWLKKKKSTQFKFGFLNVFSKEYYMFAQNIFSLETSYSDTRCFIFNSTFYSVLFFFFLLILQCRSFRRGFFTQEFEYVYLRNAPSAILIGLFMCPRALQSPRSGEFKYQRSVLEGNFCLTFQFWVETYLLTLTFKKGTNVNTREKGKSKMVGGRKREESLHMLQENWTRFRNRELVKRNFKSVQSFLLSYPVGHELKCHWWSTFSLLSHWFKIITVSYMI